LLSGSYRGFISELTEKLPMRFEKWNRRRFLTTSSSAFFATALPILGTSRMARSATASPVDIPQAKGDGVANDTAAIQSAIDLCAARGGGTVVLEGGKTYLSGTIELKSHVELHFESGAILKTIGDRSLLATQGSLIFAKDATNIAVTGRGTIEGNFRAFFTEMVEGGYKFTPTFLGPYNPLDPPSDDDPQHGRPRMIIFVNCQQVVLREFTIHDAPSWSIHPIHCEDLLIDGISIHNDMLVPNCDGLDIDCCRNVRIANCDISAGDDCITLKTSRNFPQYGMCENVTVTNCTLRSSSAAIKIEPEGPGIVRNAVFDNCVVAPSNRGICIFNRDGAQIENLIFSNFVVATELRPTMWWGAGEPVHVSSIPRDDKTKPGTIRHLRFSNFLCHGESGGFLFGGEGSPVEDVAFDNFRINVEKTSAIAGGFYDLRPSDLAPGVYKHTIAGIYAENIKGLRLTNTSVHWASNPPEYYGSALNATRVTDLDIKTFVGQSAHPAIQPAILLDGQSTTTRTPSISKRP